MTQQIVLEPGTRIQTQGYLPWQVEEQLTEEEKNARKQVYILLEEIVVTAENVIVWRAEKVGAQPPNNIFVIKFFNPLRGGDERTFVRDAFFKRELTIAESIEKNIQTQFVGPEFADAKAKFVNGITKVADIGSCNIVGEFEENQEEKQSQERVLNQRLSEISIQKEDLNEEKTKRLTDLVGTQVQDISQIEDDVLDSITDQIEQLEVEEQQIREDLADLEGDTLLVRNFAIVTSPVGSISFEDVIFQEKFAYHPSETDILNGFTSEKNNAAYTWLFEEKRIPPLVSDMFLVCAKQLGETLNTLHTFGIYHRDIKTANCIVGASPVWSLSTVLDAWNTVFGTNFSQFRITEQPGNLLLAFSFLYRNTDADQIDDTKLEQFKRFLESSNMYESGLDARWIDFDSSAFMEELSPLQNIDTIGTNTHVDPWLYFTEGDVGKYGFRSSTVRQQARTGIHGSDYWSIGVMMFEFANFFNPFIYYKDSGIEGILVKPTRTIQVFREVKMRGEPVGEEIAELFFKNAAQVEGAPGFEKLPSLNEEYNTILSSLVEPGKTGNLSITVDTSVLPSLISEEYAAEWEKFDSLLNLRLSDRFTPLLSDILEL